jgi:hypothetical protein
MVKGIDAEGFQTSEIDLLNIERRGFDDHLILVIVLKPVRVFSISTIGGPA